MPYDISYPDDTYILSESATIIYGDSGIGKTTISRTMPKPLFLIMRGGGEHRPMPLVGSGIPFIEIQTKPQLDEILLDLRHGLTVKIQKTAKDISSAVAKMADGNLLEEYRPQTIIFDQLTSMYDVYMANILKMVSRKRDTPETPNMQDYGQARRQFTNYLIEANQIPNIHKVYLSLAEMDEDEATKERYGAPMIPGKLAREVLRLMDFVFRMHTRREVRGGKLTEFRCFQTAHEGIWLAKDSSGKLPKPFIEIPDSNFDFWNEVMMPCLTK